MRERRPRAPTDAEAKRIARDLKSFLTRDVAAGKRRWRRQLKSVDQIFAPVWRFGVERLRQRARRAHAVVVQTVWRDLEQNLSKRLTFVLGPTSRVYQRAIQALAGDRPRRSWIDINPLDIFAEFPGSLETTARLISVWTEAQAELLARLVRDRDKISSTFFGKRRASRATYVRAGLSDPHDGGRTVTLLQFADRNRIIYKPRTCEGELLWFEALRWLNRNRLPVSFQFPKILQRENYGWMEFLPRSACKDLREVRRFYFRWGAQAALAQVLGASDLHRENWIATGPQPILIDAELVTGSDKDRQSMPALLETGLVPLTRRDRAGCYEGIAPLDAMLSGAEAARCWPRYKGTLRAPRKHVDELVRGFEATIEIFSNRELARQFFEEIILAKAPLERRVLLRASAEYGRLLRESLEPPRMVAQCQRLRWLTRECCASASTRPIGLAEARALSRCDIPKFTARGRTVPVARKRFPRAIGDLKRSSKILRQRVMLRTRDSG